MWQMACPDWNSFSFEAEVTYLSTEQKIDESAFQEE